MPLVIIYGLGTIIFFYAVGKIHPINKWTVIISEYREFLFDKDYTIKNISDFVKINKKSFNYFKNNFTLILLSALMGTIIAILWIMIFK